MMDKPQEKIQKSLQNINKIQSTDFDIDYSNKAAVQALLTKYREHPNVYDSSTAMYNMMNAPLAKKTNT